MQILVVGCDGQLGRDCLSVLSQQYSVSGLDLPNVDITNRSRLFEKLDSMRPDVVVNCAAYTAVDACETDPLCWKVNADGPENIAEWTAAHGAFLVHVSTDYVFDGSKPLFEAYTETDEPAPVSEYGRSKLAGEAAILKSGAEAAILRTAWLYGQNGKNFLKTMLRLALQNPDRELRVVNDQFGSPTWSLSLAQQIAEVVGARQTGVFHATSGGYCSWYDLARDFLALMNVPFRIAPCTSAAYPTAASRPENSVLENQRLNEAGINIFKDWREDLATYVRCCGVDVLEEVKGLVK